MRLNEEQEASRHIPLSLCPEACFASTHHCHPLPYGVMDPSSGPTLEKTNDCIKDQQLHIQRVQTAKSLERIWLVTILSLK